MMDPRTGQVLALASSPTFDASAIANPATAEAAWAALTADPAKPLLPRATLGTYVPGSVFKIVTAMARSRLRAPTRRHEVPPAAGCREERASSSPATRIRTAITRSPATRSSTSSTRPRCRATSITPSPGSRRAAERSTRWPGGSASARRLPFDLPTATSQLTNGGGPLPGGFLDDVELANAAYGQGETLVTPLQMALVASTVANGGVAHEAPARDRDRGPGRRRRRSGPTICAGSSAEDDAARSRRRWCRPSRADYGRLFTTGRRVPGVPTAGKSGTAQLGGTGEPHTGSSASRRSIIPRSRSRSSSSTAAAAGPARRRSRAS